MRNGFKVEHTLISGNVIKYQQKIHIFKNIFIGIGHYYQWVKRHSVQIVLSLLCQGSVSQC